MSGLVVSSGLIIILSWKIVKRCKENTWNHQKNIRCVSSMIIWLVVYLPLWKIWTSIGMVIPNIWEHKIHVPNHQLVHHLMFLPSHLLEPPRLQAARRDWKGLCQFHGSHVVMSSLSTTKPKWRCQSWSIDISKVHQWCFFLKTSSYSTLGTFNGKIKGFGIPLWIHDVCFVVYTSRNQHLCFLP